MTLPYELIAVFDAPELNFRGNISAVIPLEKALDTKDMQRIAEDLNQPATTFVWQDQDNSWHVRWFAPDAEIGLCGHGSLAAIAFLTKSSSPTVSLHYKSGRITGNMKSDGMYAMDIAPIYSEPMKPDPIVAEGLGKVVKAYYKNDNKHLVILENEEAVKTMKPDFSKLRESEVFGYVVTAPGDKVDFVSRTLVPHVRQLEDHATGSSHAVLTPFWSKRLNKHNMEAYQLSPRGGKFLCSINSDNATLIGHATRIATGKLIST